VPTSEVKGWRRALRARLVMLRLLPQVHRGLTVALAALILLAGLLPVAFTYASGSVIGAVPDAVRDGGFSTPGGRTLIGWLIAASILFFAQQVASVFLNTAAGSLGTRFETDLRLRAMRATLAPVGIAHLEDPAMLDKVTLAQGVGTGAFWPRLAVSAYTQIITSRVQAIGSAVLVGMFRWWLPFALIGAWLIIRKRLRDDLLSAVDVMRAQTHDLRRANYFRDLALTPPAAKEARIFGLAGWLRERYNTHWYAAMRDVWLKRRASWLVLVGLIVFLVAAHVAAFVLLGRAAVDGGVSLGQLAIVAGAIMGVGNIANVSNNDFQLEYALEPIPAVLELEHLTDAMRARAGGTTETDQMPARAIRFEEISFAYPGSEQLVFDGLDLHIDAGRSLAIVGLNGAGKTTLVKLLTRLYEPSRGRITVDDIDLAHVDPEAWRRRTGAIFQDFVRYEMSVTDNVGFGALSRRGDEGALARAAERAGATEIIADLERGWDTTLSRRYAAGTDLSGGQWQRIALARAMFAVGAGAGLLILDEPTANLDVRAEVEIFDRFLELTRGLTTIVISHRFSTVRRADRIVVLDGGRVVEDGSHDELMASGGRYAEMFRLQAERFRGDASEEEVAAR